MKIKNLNNDAFSLLEVLLASVIFIISIAGVFATITAVRKPVLDRETALTATIFGKQVLEALRSQVSAGSAANYYSDNTCTPYEGTRSGDQCTDFSLALGHHQVTSLPSNLTWPGNLAASNLCGSPQVTGCLQYAVTCEDGTDSDCNGTTNTSEVARKVTLTIQWPDAP